MEIRTVKVKTTHDLRPIIDLLDQTEESVESIMLLIGIGAARSAEFAANEADDIMLRRAHDIMTACEKVCEERGITHGKG